MAGLVSLNRTLIARIGERKSSCYILEVDPVDLVTPRTDRILRFQYFPESIQDTKQINRVAKEIPGGSLPVYQWVNSGERQIAFTAWFTCDVDLHPSPPGPLEFADSPLFERLAAIGEQRRNIDIRSAIVWLRQFMVPEYLNEGAVGVPLSVAPKPFYLVMPGTGIGWAGGHPGYQDASQDQVFCYMQQCDITYEAFFPSGLPRVVSVALAFVQTAQFGSVVSFPRMTTTLEESIGGTAKTDEDLEGFYGYPLQVTNEGATK